jgi:hypothetical protein
MIDRQQSSSEGVVSANMLTLSCAVRRPAQRPSRTVTAADQSLIGPSSSRFAGGHRAGQVSDAYARERAQTERTATLELQLEAIHHAPRRFSAAP